MKNVLLFCADCLEGTKDLVEEELKKLGPSLVIYESGRDDSVVFCAEEDYSKLKSLKKVLAIYYLLCFPIKGPGNLLKANYLADINLHIQKAVKNSLDFQAKTFRINAPGDESKTYYELIEKIEHFTGLRFDKEGGDLLLRFRKHSSGTAWEVLIRLSSRLRSARMWREFNFKGALNPVLANILYDLTGIKKGDRLINVMSGSGTLLIEAGQRHKLSRIVGVENNDEVLKISEKHIRNAMLKEIEIFNMDAQSLEFPDDSFDVALADLPWGENIGERSQNETLYLNTLKELKRVLVSNGKIGLITQDIRNIEHVIKTVGFTILHRRKVYQGGFHPEIFILKK